jgi:hypothetical protein
MIPMSPARVAAPSPDDLHQAFRAEVASILGNREKYLTSKGDQALSRFLHRGAEQLSSHDFNEEIVSQAQQQLARFAYALADAAERADTNAVDESIFRDVWDFFCPEFWPFC